MTRISSTVLSTLKDLKRRREQMASPKITSPAALAAMPAGSKPSVTTPMKVAKKQAVADPESVDAAETQRDALTPLQKKTLSFATLAAQCVCVCACVCVYMPVNPPLLILPLTLNTIRCSILLMEEILHHLKSLKSQKLQYFRAPRWCKISSINSMIVYWGVVNIRGSGGVEY